MKNIKAIVIIILITSIKLNAQTSNEDYEKILIGNWKVLKTKSFGQYEDIELVCSDFTKITFEKWNNVFTLNSVAKEKYSWKIDGKKIYFTNIGIKKQFSLFDSEYELKTISISMPYTIELFNSKNSITIQRE